MDPFRDLIEQLRRARSVVAFTGAGISAESGIPTYRGEGGLWDRYPPSRFGTLPGLAAEFLIHPQKVARFFIEILDAFLDARPNPAHDALATLEAKGLLQGVITQNIDDLHERAGTRRLAKLHGSLSRIRCPRCRSREEVPRERLQAWAQRLKGMKVGRKTLLEQLAEIIPRCPHCLTFRRPDVVFFGEGLPEEEWDQAIRWAKGCDLMLVVGTSGIVHPAAELPRIAKRAGAVVAVIDEERGELSEIADLFLVGHAGSILAGMLEPLGGFHRGDRS